MNGNSTSSVVVDSGGTGVVAHVGLHALGRFADALALPQAFSARVAQRGERAPVHDRGKVVCQSMLMLAGGGRSCADIEHLRAQHELFGEVPSDSTLWRTFNDDVDAPTLAGLWEAMGALRRRVWDLAGVATGGEVLLDIDASLHGVHSENKEGTAATYKGGFGFHPMYCTADATGEVLAMRMRPGNAAANNIADHVAVLDAAIEQLPTEIAVGHRPGDDPALVRRGLRVRTDSAGCTSFVWHCHERNVGFSVTARHTAQIHGTIANLAFDDERWCAARTQDGEQRAGAAVAELTDLVDLSDWPPGTRLVVRREPRHPGAQQSLFDCETFRYWGHYTTCDADPVDADVDMRAHAHVEDSILALKETGASRFPFSDLAANTAWLAVVCFADSLVRWFQALCLTGALAKARAATLRWQLWHTPARVVRKARRVVIRVLDGWPNEHDLVGAYQRIAALC